MKILSWRLSGGTKENQNIAESDNQCPVQDLKQESPEYKPNSVASYNFKDKS
jgi:hypothetical protein